MGPDIIAQIRRDHVRMLAHQGKRSDGRQLRELRPIHMETGLIETAEGSCRVHLGDTDVLVGIKASLGEPFSDTPDKGVLTTNVELLPIASPRFDSGPHPHIGRNI